MKNVIVVGAGQLGSRHVQALKGLKEALRILVVDPSEESLQLTKRRYEEIAGSGAAHQISYYREIPEGFESPLELGIVATSANVRFKALQSILGNSRIRYLILEKVLFSEPQHYQQALDLLGNIESGPKIWVNCPMREIPVYQRIKNTLEGLGPLSYKVKATGFGFMTNLIHYVDHMCHILNLHGFSVETAALNKHMIPSKRSGFLECTGAIELSFSDGSVGSFTNSQEGKASILLEISAGKEKFRVSESEGLAWHCGLLTSYEWQEIDGGMPPQSILTTRVAENIFNTGQCFLPEFEESVLIHQNLYEPIRGFLMLSSYPWT